MCVPEWSAELERDFNYIVGWELEIDTKSEKALQLLEYTVSTKAIGPETTGNSSQRALPIK